MPALLKCIDWSAISTWSLGFVLTVYLSLEGGGFDPLVHDRVGIAVWWVLLGTVVIGALPRRRLGTFAWCALGLLAAFAIWTALSLGWTESTEKTSADLARVAAYLGVFALALFTPGPRSARHMLGAVGTGIAVIALLALLSRLHPAWFPTADPAAGFLSSARERLSYPLGYWNALAALIAIGLPTLLQAATCAKATILRSLAAAALPAMALTIFFTLSRSGMMAAALALVLFLALAPNRLPKLLTLLVAGAGGAILIVAAAQRHALQHGLFDVTARHQGDVMLGATLLVCISVGLIQAGLSRAAIHRKRPHWTMLSRRRSLTLALAAMLVALIAASALDAPGRALHAWSDFKRVEKGSLRGVERLDSTAGESRYQFWVVAVREYRAKPLTGTGSGTFEYWWDRDGTTESVVRDAHSLYVQTLGELGLVGLGTLTAFLLAVLLGGTRAVLRAGHLERTRLAAALAGCVAFCLTAGLDWVWQIPALPVAFLLLASTLVAANASPSHGARALRLPLRIGFATIAVIAIAIIAIPLSSTALVRQSRTAARAGERSVALRAALAAESAQPGAATPRLQEALLLESDGNLSAAAASARAGTERERTNWRTWLVLSRIEAERSRAAAALRAYRRAKSLNPRSPLFAQ